MTRELTQRELFVLQRAAVGDTYQQIGRKLGLTRSAAQSRAERAMVKLGARSVTQAVAIVLDRGLIHPLDCGNLRTYWWHVNHGEAVDPVCMDARAEYQRDLRRRRKERECRATAS